MDLQTLYAGLSKRLGVEILEADHPQLATLDGLVGYLRERVAGPAS